MIIFLNFAPFEFFGGAEKWMTDTAAYINKKEPVTLVSVSQQISNYYSELVLKRKFDGRANIDPKNYSSKISLSWSNFFPFTKQWHDTKTVFKQSKIIYLKYELLEIFIVIYFGGFKSLRKIIAGLHTSFLYPDPITFFDKLHNFLYSSFLSNFFLKHIRKVHVITTRDKIYLEKNFHLTNVTYVPNYIHPASKKLISLGNKENKNLNIIFVGELSPRKGVDVLIKVIEISPPQYHFIIIGNGILKEKILDLQKIYPNVTYQGFLTKEKIYENYKKSDILFLPSRAEGFSLSILEAMSFGLVIVDTNYIKLDLPDFIEYSEVSDPKKFIEVFNKIFSLKHNFQLSQTRTKIADFFDKNYSAKIILPKISELLLT